MRPQPTYWGARIGLLRPVADAEMELPNLAVYDTLASGFDGEGGAA